MMPSTRKVKRCVHCKWGQRTGKLSNPARYWRKAFTFSGQKGHISLRPSVSRGPGNSALRGHQCMDKRNGGH